MVETVPSIPIPMDHPYLSMARPHNASSKSTIALGSRQADLCPNDLILPYRVRILRVMPANCRIEQAVLLHNDGAPCMLWLCSLVTSPIMGLLWNPLD